jgi:Spy/CpxP family protein refolding chaperone
MNASLSSRATKLVSGLAFLGVALSVLMIGSTPVLAVSCDDVRALTKVEQNFWAKKLSLTPDQRQRIWQECYGQPRVREAKGDLVQPVTDRH